jgi:hypothetical protein
MFNFLQEIPSSRSIAEYDCREFAEEEVVYSSFTYLIDAARIIGALQALGQEPTKPSDPLLEIADTKLVNWLTHLPRCKQEIIDEDGKFDEILFHAHLLINT